MCKDRCRDCGILRWMLGVIVCTSLFSSYAQAQLLPLQISSNKRYLQTSDGKPFFWMGDMVWKIYRLSPTELDQYFATRKAQGFNVIQGPVLFAENNYAGHDNLNPTSPNPQWFAHIDTIIDKAAEYGFYVVPVLLWYDNVDDFNQTTIYNFAKYVGQRYRNRTNIAAFFVGGEFNHPDNNTAFWNQAAMGLLDGLDGAPRMISALPRWYGTWGGQSSSDALHNYNWLSFNSIQSSQFGDCTNNSSNLYYSGAHNWVLVQQDWNRTPVKPVLDAEATLERALLTNISQCQFNPTRWQADGVRRRAYWSVFAGGFGHTYGANGVYQFHKNYDPFPEFQPQDYWHVAINYEGANDMIHLRRLMESRPFFTRVPGQDMLMSPNDNNVPTHVQVTRDANGKYAMAYIPNTGRTITVDMDLLTGTLHKFWWYNPMNGEASFIGTFTRSNYGSNGSFSRTTPNSGVDWVLVIDDASENFPPPGQSAPSAPAGDVNGDGQVNTADLLDVINDWGECNSCAADINNDGIVDVEDLLTVIETWD